MEGRAWRVVSDVDHTLLESPEESELAGRCLRRLGERGIANLLASSKTFAEMVALQQRAQLTPQPFLFENGCGIGWPTMAGDTTGIEAAIAAAGAVVHGVQGGYAAIVRGRDAAGIRALLLALRDAGTLPFSLLDELGFAEIERRLGLPEALARQALQRLGSVPLVWHAEASTLDRLRTPLADQGLRLLSGGRLLHVAPPFDKGEALAEALRWQGEPSNGRRLLACGDSENDRGLLESADLALVFHPPGAEPLALAPSTRQRRRTAIAGGPQLWLEAVEAALEAEAATPSPSADPPSCCQEAVLP